MPTSAGHPKLSPAPRELLHTAALVILFCASGALPLAAQSVGQSVADSGVLAVRRGNGRALVPGVVRFDACIGTTILACPPAWTWRDDESPAYRGGAARPLNATAPDRVSRARADQYFEPRTTTQGDVLTLKPAPGSSVRALLDPRQVRNTPRLRL